MKKIIGIIGFSGAGKSTFCSYLKNHSVYVIDADKIARNLLKAKSPLLTEVVKAFGSKILLSDLSLNRKLLGKIVFNNKEELDKLNSITKEKIEEEIINKINNAKANIIAVDCAILLDTKIKDMCDEIVYISADKNEMIERIMKRDNIDKDTASARIKSQEIDYKNKATIIINNDNDLTGLENHAAKLYRRLINNE